MQNFPETTRKVIGSAREIINGLYAADDTELHEFQEDVSKLQELLVYLKVSNSYGGFYAEEEGPVLPAEPEDAGEVKVDNLAEIEVDETPEENFAENLDDSEVDDVEEDTTEELSAEPLPEFYEKDFVESEEPDFVEEIPVNPELLIAEEELEAQEEILEEESIEEEYAEEIAMDPVKTEESNRGKIIDIEHENQQSVFTAEESQLKKEEEKKFKLANIKGLRKIQSLFDEDPLEKEEAMPVVESAGDLQRRNVPTDYLEAKVYPEFKLDLNDRIAFTKILFDGSQTDLNETIRELNGFNSLDQAKEYLSDLYYARKWDKADEYAQRLWSLVESRFV